MEFRLLGPLEVINAGRALRLGGMRLPAVAATLLLNANKVVTVEHLAHAVWSQPPRAFGSNLRTYIAQLRGTFVAAGVHDSRVVTEPVGYRLEVRPGELDLTRFEELVAEGEEALTGSARDVGLDRLRSALALWRGDALAGVTGSSQLGAEVARLEERRLHVAARWARTALAAGYCEDASVELTRLVGVHPLREHLWIDLMLAHYRSGRQAAALSAYQDAYRLLVEELGVRPSQPLRRLHQQILNADPALDLPPEGARAKTPAPSVGPAMARPRQLPADIASFAGRTDQLGTLDVLVGDRSRPAGALAIATITGGAGVGKTSLAVHWAHRVAHCFPDGQLYVNLRGLRPNAVRPAEVVRDFLEAFALTPQQIPASEAAQAALYRSVLADKRVLVVLDNARDAHQIRPLLPGAPGCLVVVTSRDRLLGLVAELGAHPLPLDVLPEAEATDLLSRRLGARRVAAEPRAVADIIARCARTPLALSIVAAHAATQPKLPLAALAAELRQHASGTGTLVGESLPELGG